MGFHKGPLPPLAGLANPLLHSSARLSRALNKALRKGWGQGWDLIRLSTQFNALLQTRYHFQNSRSGLTFKAKNHLK